MIYVYILFSEKLNRHYIGQTDCLERRILQHNSGKSKYTSRGIPWQLIWFTIKPSRSEAMILEKKLKNLSQERLKRFVQKYN